MKKTAKEIIEMLTKECEENGYYFLVQIDDNENIYGRSHARTDSRLDHMAQAVNNLADSCTRTITK